MACDAAGCMEKFARRISAPGCPINDGLEVMGEFLVRIGGGSRIAEYVYA
jgi:hypothetical protein